MSCEDCFGRIGKRCDRSKDCCSECGLLGGYFCCVPCNKEAWGREGMPNLIGWFVSCGCITFVPIIFGFLILNCFWVASVASQAGQCNLVIWTNLTCGFWSMFLEVVTFVSIIALPTLFMTCCLVVSLTCLGMFGYFLLQALTFRHG